MSRKPALSHGFWENPVQEVPSYYNTQTDKSRLIGKGYGTISWGFFILHGVALFTIGLYKIMKKSKA